FHARSEALDLRGADENHFCWQSQKVSFADGAVHLASVGIAADGNIERAKSRLFRVLDFSGEQNRTRAGAESWLYANELLQLLEPGVAQQLEKCARLAAGDDEPVDLIELLRLFDEHNFRAQLFEPTAVRVEIAL